MIIVLLISIVIENFTLPLKVDLEVMSVSGQMRFYTCVVIHAFFGKVIQAACYPHRDALSQSPAASNACATSRFHEGLVTQRQ